MNWWVEWAVITSAISVRPSKSKGVDIVTSVRNALLYMITTVHGSITVWESIIESPSSAL